MDEERFLRSVHAQFRGVVYLPWPLCQFLVTDGDLVETVYSTSSKSLAFVSLRISRRTSRPCICFSPHPPLHASQLTPFV